jgi:serine/threonine protein kinase
MEQMICEEDFVQSTASSLTDFSASSPSLPDIGTQQISTYDDLIIMKKINIAKFPVYLSYSPSANQYLAMKVFPFTQDRVNPFFVNEARFAALNHENVISIVHYEIEREAVLEEAFQKISFTVMELAPFGDFFDVIMIHRICFDEKLARTYFHQLIEGVEYLHSNGVSHMDLKLENLLLGNNYVLKIADFDQAFIRNQESVITKGTVCYRAPELIRSDCQYPEAADVYSAGIILFLLKSGGILPHSEHQKYKGLDLFDLMCNSQRVFWEKHCEIQGRELSFFDQDFRELFDAMVSFNPEERPTIVQIKNSKWYNGPTYSYKEVSLIMSQNF